MGKVTRRRHFACCYSIMGLSVKFILVLITITWCVNTLVHGKHAEAIKEKLKAGIKEDDKKEDVITTDRHNDGFVEQEQKNEHVGDEEGHIGVEKEIEDSG